MEEKETFAAFCAGKLLGQGPVEAVLDKARLADQSQLRVFSELTGKQVDFDLRGTLAEALARLLQHPHFRAQGGEAPRRGPGRPKLGIACREVCLMPKQWEWLDGHSEGASAFLRKLVHQAMQQEPDKKRARKALEAADRMMSALAGDLPGYEEASRALWAGQAAQFKKLSSPWPKDIRVYLAARVEEAVRLGGSSPADLEGAK